ncbi:hypothetical protein AKJ16_DCAP21134 [Drosera capensis]
MYRSSSNTRVSDEYSKYSTSPPSQTTCGGGGVVGGWSLGDDGGGGGGGGSGSHHLPVYNPNSHASKKENSRLRSAENAVHFIPLVLVGCAVILWFCSNPVDLVRKGDSVVAKVEGLKVASGIDVDGTQNSLLPHFELDNVDGEGYKTKGKPLG